ncbi:MAG: hypothetical protein ABSD57_13085 [Verrucomicrobiota bacterium]|jgi:hypothetical protein
MKKSAKIPWLRFGVGLLCLNAWTVYPQELKPQPETTVPATTNKLLDNASSRLTPPPPNSLEPEKTNLAQPGEITTLNGKTYKSATVQRVDPDGLTIGYTPAGGGTGAVKIKFKNLPDDLQRQYKYDPDKAAAYEARQAQGMAAWRAQREKETEAAKRAATQRAEQDALEQQKKEELEQQGKTAQKEMTEQQKKEAQKQIEATWSGFTSSVKAGRITN